MKAIFGLDIPNELLREEYEFGESVKSLSEKYGRSEPTVRKHLRSVECEMQNMRMVTAFPRVSDEDIKHFYETGESFQTIAILCGCSATTIQKRLRHIGCAIRSVGTEENRRRASARGQGITYDEWTHYAVKNDNYCPKFDDDCRESNRDKYDRRCFLCGKTEAENERKLSVHHVDMNRDQGCNGHVWKLVPVCGSCHSKIHNLVWRARIEYLLQCVW